MECLESLDSLSQLQVKLPVMIWTGTWALLTSKDLITPDPPHNTLAGASVWCQTLQGSSKVSARFLQGVSGETHGDLYCQSHILTPVDGTLLAWLMLAWGLSAPSGASATTSHVSTPRGVKGNWDCH